MPKAFHAQTKQMIASLIEYFQRERENGGPLIPITSVRERVADALKINVRSVSMISRQVKANEPLRSPKKKRPRKKPVCDISPSEQTAMRNCLYDMVQERKHVTRASLLEVLKQKQIFNASVTSLGRVLKTIGFRYDKNEPRKGLMELSHVVSARINFLRNYIGNLNSDRPWECVFLDETWIFENGTVTRSWQDGNPKSVRKLKVDGKRFIVLHAGNANGFIEGASLVFSSNTNNPDYHGEMNQNNFLKWFENSLLKRLEEPSMIIMDNASYHSTLEDKCPNGAWRKADIMKWLTNHNIQFGENLLKAEFLAIVSRNKPPKTYVADKLAQQYGHLVLRLPPYHCIFNPIEKIWGIAKTYYSRHIGCDGFGQENAVKMWKEALEHVTPTMWQNTIKHTDKIIEEWWERELIFDREEIAPIIINLGESDSEDSYEDSDSDDAENNKENDLGVVPFIQG